VRLFAELENTPARQRKSEEFKAKDRELARRLDLTTEWWMMCNVLDRATKPCHPPWCSAHAGFFKCREVRLPLLDAAKNLRLDA
jgi:hypothetical protein